jgi:hypothetical protein
MREVSGTIVGALTLGPFVALFAWVMNQTQQPNADMGMMWVWAIVLMVAFVAIMGTWHRLFASTGDTGTPPPKGSRAGP